MTTDTPLYEQSQDISSKELQKALEIIRDMMGEIHHEASLGVKLNEMNISNDWAEGIKAIFKAPVKSSYEALQSIEKSIRDMIDDQIKDYLHSKKHLIQGAYRISEERLHYAIVLKEHSIDNEAEIIEFKMDYDETPVSQKFPLIISFVEKQNLEGAQIQEQLDIG